MDVYVIDLVKDQCHGQFEETKISSSSLRKRLLGTLINPVKVFAKLFKKWMEWLPNSLMSLDSLSFEIRRWFIKKCRFFKHLIFYQWVKKTGLRWIVFINITSWLIQLWHKYMNLIFLPVKCYFATRFRLWYMKNQSIVLGISYCVTLYCFVGFQPNKNIPSSPYVLGLTGGIGSGKSAICKRLEGLGAGTVDCDKLGI